jgi:hypothetical protein
VLGVRILFYVSGFCVRCPDFVLVGVQICFRCSDFVLLAPPGYARTPWLENRIFFKKVA